MLCGTWQLNSRGGELCDFLRLEALDVPSLNHPVGEQVIDEF
jgi:hypothetical protein